jgi:hypothetical protein
LKEWKKQIVRPFQVEYTQKEVHWQKYHWPVPQLASLGHDLVGHLTKDDHDGGVDKDTNQNPRYIKASSDYLGDTPWYEFLTFVDYPS